MSEFRLVKTSSGHLIQVIDRVVDDAVAPPERAGPQLCRHLGEPTGFTPCGGCCGGVRLKKFECTLHNVECVPANKAATDKAIRWCHDCKQRDPITSADPAEPSLQRIQNSASLVRAS